MNKKQVKTKKWLLGFAENKNKLQDRVKNLATGGSIRIMTSPFIYRICLQVNVQ